MNSLSVNVFTSIISGEYILNSEKNNKHSGFKLAHFNTIGKVILIPSLKYYLTRVVISRSSKSAPILKILEVDITTH